MATEIEPWVQRFLAERGPGEASVTSRPALEPLAEELNALWWREVERLVLRAVRENPDRLVFSPEERLLLDLGLLDARLVPGAERNRTALLREIYAPGRPGCFYLSEWLAQRYRQFLLYGGLSPREGESPLETRVIRDRRTWIYMQLALLFKNLPGFTPQAVDLLVSGRIDETLDAMALRLEKEEDARLAEQRRQLQEIRSRMLARARERARAEKELYYFDELRELDRQMAEKRGQRKDAGEAAAAAPRSLPPQERERWALDELRFVRSVLWLGVAGSGLARTYSVLLTSQPRLGKAELDAILSLAKQCDPALPDVAGVVIAPYMGGGFYEWERDALFVPLVATRSAEQAVVSALAAYRILLDKFHDGGRLRREYELAFGEEDSQAGFVRDYKAWVLGVGKGFKGALDPGRFAFFRDFFGPQAADLYAPREWAALTPQEEEETVRQCRARVNRAEAGFEDYYRLAIAAARERQYVQAIQHLQAALTLAPMDGRALLALGTLHAKLGGVASAKAKFNECMALAPGTIWSVYAGDELQKL
ncbi:MAG TPA: hypothetical protein VNO22_11435 [Planctomycetota bacterium]|nr:hypothetical protein [Planctomycetota bacterium]